MGCSAQLAGMIQKLSIQCPAKINLFLEITGKRPDGYHRLVTLFAKINIYDVLDMKLTSGLGGPELVIEDEAATAPLSAGHDNLVLRAAKLLYEAFDVKVGVQITLKKRIPIGAGLGGGSSDAGGTLLGLGKLLGLDEGGAPYRKKIYEIARSLGADVPFFVNPHSFCIGRGIGDRLSPLKIAGPLPYLILVYPGVAISTAESYRALSLPAKKDVLTRLSQLDKLTEALVRGDSIDGWGGLLFNRLEESKVPAEPFVRAARDILSKLGLIGVRMSGSGSSVFGFASSYEEGVRVLKRLEIYPWKSFLTSCL